MKFVFEILKKFWRNVTNFGYIYVTWFHITLKKFPSDWTNSFTFITSNLFWKWYFQKRKNMQKSYGFWKINKFILYQIKIKMTKYWEKIDRLPNFLFYYFFNNFFSCSFCTFWHYYYTKWIFFTSSIWLTFVIFLFRFLLYPMSDFYYIANYWNSDRINFLLGTYVSYIFKGKPQWNLDFESKFSEHIFYLLKVENNKSKKLFSSGADLKYKSTESTRWNRIQVFSVYVHYPRNEITERFFHIFVFYWQ